MAETFLADGKVKFTILTTKPENIFAPTAEELNGPEAIQADADVLTGDFTWTPTDSDAITDQKPLRAKGNTTTYGASNFDLGMTAFRRFEKDTGAELIEAEPLWAAIQNKGSVLYGYARESGKDATEPWADCDVSYLGGQVVTDEPQRIDGEGFIRRRIPMGAQNMDTNITIGAAAGGSGE